MGEDTVFDARWRLAWLWVSQTARVLADWSLRMFVVLLIARRGAEVKDSAWHLVTAVFIAPFILLSPFNGAISNSLPRRWVLTGAAGFCMAVTVACGGLLGPEDPWWLWCVGLGLAALGSAVYSPTRYALLPAAARDTGMPLPRVNGWIEAGGSAAIIGGMVLGLYLGSGGEDGLPLSRPAALRVMTAVAALNLMSLLTALPVRFPSDVWRPEPAGRAVAGFFRDSRRIFRVPESRATLLGLASFLGLVTAGSGAIVAHVLSIESDPGHGSLIAALVYVTGGAALGCGLTGIQGHPRRSLGLIPLASTGLLAVLAWAAVRGGLHWLPCLLLGVMGGLANVPLRAAYQAAVPADARGNGMAVMNLAIYVVTSALAVLLTILVRSGILKTPLAQLGFLAVLAGGGALVSWYALFAPWLELMVEVLLGPFYRVRVCGPAGEGFPERGPLLVIANHASWMDPLWLAKMLPRRLTPMMTSAFYDKPGLRWLMKHAAGAIRVPAEGFRREAPELDKAVAVLDRGGCVLIFPEGRLRREEAQLLRHFGQGVWHILVRRPQTPVVACWIEGGWGSFTSYKDGPPTVNKRLDWRRPITIGIRAPEVLDPALLENQRATRQYLMNACLEARALLGLPLPEPSDTEPAMAEDQKDD